MQQQQNLEEQECVPAIVEEIIPKKPKKKFSDNLMKVFKGFSQNPPVEDEQKNKKVQQIQPPVEESQTPPILDLLNFEYLYSSLKSISESSVKKCIDCIKIMTHDPIDQAKLSHVIYLGVDEDMKALRAITWRILIGYLPPSRKQWIIILERNKINYDQLIDENILTKIKKQQQNNKETQVVEKKANDHPLNRSKESQWNTYFEDHQLWVKIEQDTRRTRQKDGFFAAQNTNKLCEEYEQGIIPILSKSRQNSTVEYNYDVLTRILFLYAKLHNGYYVQGMNEVVALIYYCYVNDESKFLKKQAEVDAFYCFSIMMTSLKENFHDSNQSEHNENLKERIRQFSELLKKADVKLFDHFQKLHLDLKFFCIKWFVASFAQELAICDTLKIWDAIVCQPNKNEFVHYLSLSFLLFMREDLLKSEFGEVMMKIQNLESQNLDINKIINNAYLLQKEFRK